MKCRQCGKEITKENAIQIKTRLYACSEKCKQDYEKAHAPQDNVDNGRKMLFDYIKTVAPDVNFRLVGIQLANLMKEYPDMTYNGIAYTIKYIKHLQSQIIDLKEQLKTAQVFLIFCFLHI